MLTKRTEVLQAARCSRTTVGCLLRVPHAAHEGHESAYASGVGKEVRTMCLQEVGLLDGSEFLAPSLR